MSQNEILACHIEIYLVINKTSIFESQNDTINNSILKLYICYFGILNYGILIYIENPTIIRFLNKIIIKQCFGIVIAMQYI